MLDFRHKLGPGFLILIAFLCFGAATILQLVVSIGLPTISGVYFLTFTLARLGQTVKFGVWTICTDQFYSSFSMSDSGSTCQPTSLGYEGTQFGQIADFLLIKNLAKALVIQPIACGFSGFATVACLLHLCSNWLIWPFITFIAGALGILVFVFEIILFTTARVRLNSDSVEQYFGQGISESSLGPAIWIQLVAALIVAFGVLMSWTAYIARKVKKTHTGKLGTSVRGSVYNDSEVGSSYPMEKRSTKKGGMFAMAAPAMLKGGKGGKVGKGGFLSRFRGDGKKEEDQNSSAVAVRSAAAPIAGAGAGQRRASKGAKVSRSYGRDEDFADIAGRRRSRYAGGEHLSPTHSRRSSGAAVTGTRTARTAALAGGTRSSRGSKSGGSAKEAYTSRRHSARAEPTRRSAPRRSESSGDDIFHEADDGGDRADLGYLLGSRPYSYPSGRHTSNPDRSRSHGRHRPELRDRSRSRDARRSGDDFAVKRKPAPSMRRDESWGSGNGTRSSGMTRYTSDPLREHEDSFVSPRKGRRSTRYSARMAEEGWE